ncbi:MAG: tetratricopeptide repeat protein [Gemmatimonadota bacterium]
MRRRREVGAFAVLAVFVIENQCGLGAADRQQLAVHFLEQGHFDRALVEARRAAREDGGASQPHVIAALAYLGLEQLDDAVAQLLEAVEQSPDDPRLYETLRRVCAEQQRLDLARDALTGLAARQPGNRLAQAALGWVQLETGQTGPAIDLLEAAADGDSVLAPAGRAFARLALGQAYMAAGRYGDAAAALREAARLDSGDARLHLTLGECHLRQGDDDGAAAAFGRALALAPEPGAAAARVAQLYYDQGRRRQAIGYYEQALRQLPGRAMLLNNLAWAYAEENLELARAEGLSLAAVKEEPGSVVYLDTYAEILCRRGRSDRAVAVMRRALELEPPEGENYRYLHDQMARFRLAAGVPAAADSLL